MSSALDFSIIQDFSYGQTSTSYRIGPTDMKLFDDEVLIVSGVIDNVGNTRGYGVIMMFDKDDLSVTKDQYRFEDDGNIKYYPVSFDVSEEKNIMIAASPAALVSEGVYYSGIGYRTDI